jgi:alkanesulfonate monooxygenase SsuD/methylene tetrahydromethanopterin reductase-like flavin-dependent oxidoreductase (luciferase family)
MHRDGSVDKQSTPLLNNENDFKLAVFGTNVSHGCTMTTAEGTIAVDWNETTRIAQLADQAGLDGLVPVARWRGFAGLTNFNDRSFETLTWAAGLSAVTERIQILATVHIPTIHPVRAAKEVATIDHISGGRFGLNVVAGWNEGEIRMFGTTQRDHDERYEVAEEWLTLATRLWSEDTFDFEGEYFSTPGAHSEPKPIQSPYPVIMSAGASPRGMDFAARNADLNFIQAPDIEGHADKVKVVREAARERYGREISVMGMGAVICADTEKEAREYFDYYVHEKGDWPGVSNLLQGVDGNVQSMDFQTRQVAINMIGGYSAQPLLGTPEQVVDGILRMRATGLNGITLSWVNYAEGIEQYREKLLPLLVQAGLRCELAPRVETSPTPAGVGSYLIPRGRRSRRSGGRRAARVPAMVKVYHQLPKRPDITPEAFQQHWRVIHAGHALRIGRIRRYAQSHRLRPGVPGWDGPDAEGVVEVWFDDLESALALEHDRAYTAGALLDEPNFIDVQRFSDLTGAATLFTTLDVVRPGPEGQPSGVKVLLFARRDAGLSPVDFASQWRAALTDGAPDALLDPGQRLGLAASLAEAYPPGRTPRWDAVAELSWSSYSAFVSAWQDGGPASRLLDGIVDRGASCAFSATEYRVIWPAETQPEPGGRR